MQFYRFEGKILFCRAMAVVATCASLLAVRAALAVDNGPSISPSACMQRVFIGPTGNVTNANQLNCTANDIRLSRAISVSQSSCIVGSHFNLTGTFETIVTANARYDAGFFFRTDGGANARGDGASASGICSLSQLTPGVSPSLNLDNDTCGDLNAGTYNVTFTIPNVLCQDTDGDGFLNLPNCTSWHSNQGTACTLDNSPYDANPDTKSKCVCDDTFQVPVRVERANLTVVKTANPTQLDEPGGSVDFTVKITNPATVISVNLTKLEEDDNNDGVIDITFDANSTPTLASICDTTIIGPGATATCTFTRTVSGNAGQSSTDKACVSGTDSNTPPNPVGPSCATATVSIKDVKPTAGVTKDLVGALCTVVRYSVKVDNTDLVESLTLSALNDNQFGDITTVHDDVVNTGCTVPRTIAAGKSFTCTFDATVCESTHTDKITATLNDDEGNSVSPVSNEVSVTITATTP